MTGASRNRNQGNDRVKLTKRILDSRWVWDRVLGPVYNRRIWDTAGDFVGQMIEWVPPPRGSMESRVRPQNNTLQIVGDCAIIERWRAT